MLEKDKIIFNVELDLNSYRLKKSPSFIKFCKNVFEDEKNKICDKSIVWKYTLENNKENKIIFVYNGNYEDYNIFLKNLENASIAFTAICSGLINKGIIKISLPNVKDEDKLEIFETILTMDDSGVIYNNNRKFD